jgi:hypothetical protein
MPTVEEMKLWREKHIPEAMKAAREAYEAVYNDPYRSSGVGYFKRYLNKFDKMISAMAHAVDIVLLKRFFDNKVVPEGGLDCSSGPIEFYHELNHFIMNARCNKTHEEDRAAMPVLEKYLVQVHVFLDRGEFDQFSVYSRDCDGKYHWFSYFYDETVKGYTVTDEDLDEWVEAFNIREKLDFAPDAEEHMLFGDSYLTRNLQSVLKRLRKHEKGG